MSGIPGTLKVTTEARRNNNLFLDEVALVNQREIDSPHFVGDLRTRDLN